MNALFDEYVRDYIRVSEVIGNGGSGQPNFYGFIQLLGERLTILKPARIILGTSGDMDSSFMLASLVEAIHNYKLGWRCCTKRPFMP